MSAAPALACAVAVAMSAALVAAGTRLRRWLRLPLAPSLRVPVDLALGAGVLAVGVVLLGLVGLLRPVTLAAAVVALAVGGRWRSSRRWELLVPPALAGAVALPAALGPPFFYDSLVYHLGLPWQALLEHGFMAHSENVFAAFPPLAQCVYAPALALGLDRVPAILHWIAFVAAGAAIFSLARGLGAPPLAAALAGACVPVLPSHILVPAFPAAEGWLAVAAASAYAVLLRHRVGSGAPALAGLLVGVASAARVQGLPWALGAGVLVALRADRRRRAVVAVAVGWVVGAAPWWLKNVVLLGDPLAPLGWRREGMATLWRDGGSALLLGDGPGPIARGALATLAPFAPWLLALALAAALAMARGGDRRLWWVAGCVAIGTVAWSLGGVLPRFFAMPAMFLLALAAAGRRAASQWAGGTALVLTAVIGILATAGLVTRLGVWGSAGGDERAALAAVIDSPAAAFAAASALPDEARVLLVGEPRGFSFPRRFVAPSQHDVSPAREVVEGAATWEEARDELVALSFTHLLVARAELARLAPAYPVAPWRTETGRRRFGDLLRALSPPVVAADGVEIYNLGGRTTAPPERQASP